MQLVVLGATGGTGSELVVQALAQGHQVVAVVRDPARLSTTHTGLRVMQADVLDPSAIEPALVGADAVLFALGSRAKARSSDVTVCSTAMPSVLTAMQASGVRRIVAISSSMVSKHDPGDSPVMRRMINPVMHRFFGPLYADLALMESQLRDSDSDWTVFRAPLLNNRPPGARYRTAIGRNPGGGAFPQVSRADLAGAMLGSLSDDSTLRTTVGIIG